MSDDVTVTWEVLGRAQKPLSHVRHVARLVPRTVRPDSAYLPSLSLNKRQSRLHFPFASHTIALIITTCQNAF